MRSLNRVMLIGNLGTDPELRHTPNGNAVASFSLATNESWGGRDGQPAQERTEWHKIVVWGRLAEVASEYLRKGRQLYVEGRLQTRQWQDQQGNKRFTTEIVAQNFVMLGGRGDAGPAGPAPAGAAGAAGAPGRESRGDWGNAPEPSEVGDANGSQFIEEDNDLPF